MVTNYKVKFYSDVDENMRPKLLSPFVRQSTEANYDFNAHVYGEKSPFDWFYEFWDFYR